MSLFDKIRQDREKARVIIYSKDIEGAEELKALEKIKYDCTTLLLGEVDTISKNINGDMSDNDILSICKKYLKSLDATLSAINDLNAENIDTIQRITIEKDYINKLLPDQLNRGELIEIIDSFIVNNEVINIGTIMSYLKKNYDNRYNGKIASSIIRDIIS